MSNTDDYDPSTALTAYFPSRSERRIARHWAREKMLHDWQDIGAVDFFEGGGSDPTVLSGYAANKLWLRVDEGVTDAPGTIRYYAGGDATLLASWPEVTREGFSGHIRARSEAELDFAWSTATSGDPGTGKIRGNSATLASITQIALSKTGRLGQSYAARLAAIDDDDALRVYGVGGNENFLELRLTGLPTDQSTYYTIACTVRASSSLTNGQVVGVTHYPTSQALDREQRKFVLVTSGQSNGQLTRSKNWTPPSNLYVWNNVNDASGTATVDVGDGWAAPSNTTQSIPVMVAAAYAREYPGADIYLINVSRGSQYIKVWLDSSATKYMWTGLKANVEAALTNLGVTQIDRFGFFQAESDEDISDDPDVAGTQKYWELWPDRYDEFIEQLRGETWFPYNCPIGQWVPNYDFSLPRFGRMALNIAAAAVRHPSVHPFVPPLETDGATWLDLSAHLGVDHFAAAGDQFFAAVEAGGQWALPAVDMGAAMARTGTTAALTRDIPDGTLFTAPNAVDPSKTDLLLSFGWGTVSTFLTVENGNIGRLSYPLFNGARIETSGTDLDTLTVTGTYRTQNPVNGPSTITWTGQTVYIEVISDDGLVNQVTQVLTWVAHRRQFLRQKTGASTWTAWTEIMTALALSSFDGPVSASQYSVGGLRVVSSRQTALADLSGGATTLDCVNAINGILARLRAHGLIAP